MNCKPGELAVIVRGKRNLGRIVKVEAVSHLHGPGWWFVSSTGGLLSGTWSGTTEEGRGKEGHIEDSRLRPIRDPGDDAQDETLQWKPINRPEEVC